MANGIQDLNVNLAALGCLHIIKSRAIVSFPGSTRAAPSEFAFVSLGYGGALRPNWNCQFPFEVPWDLWQNFVVPVLLYLRKNPLNPLLYNEDQMLVVIGDMISGKTPVSC